MGWYGVIPHTLSQPSPIGTPYKTMTSPLVTDTSDTVEMPCESLKFLSSVAVTMSTSTSSSLWGLGIYSSFLSWSLYERYIHSNTRCVSFCRVFHVVVYDIVIPLLLLTYVPYGRSTGYITLGSLSVSCCCVKTFLWNSKFSSLWKRCLEEQFLGHLIAATLYC